MRRLLVCLIACSTVLTSFTAVAAASQTTLPRAAHASLLSPSTGRPGNTLASRVTPANWLSSVHRSAGYPERSAARSLSAEHFHPSPAIYRHHGQGLLLERPASRGAIPVTRSMPTWQPSTAPSPPGPPNPYGEVYLLACSSAGICTGIGTYTNKQGVNLPLIYTRSSAGKWTEMAAPLPSNAVLYPQTGPELFDLSCPKQGSCVSVGTYLTSSSEQALIETETNGTWKASTSPLPAGAGTPDPAAELVSIACPAAGSCIAVGDFQDNNGNQIGLIATLKNGVWQATEPALPSSLSGDAYVLVEVHCTSAGVCAAVGGYFDQNGNVQGLIYTLSAGKWTPAVPAAPKSGLALELDTMACPTSKTCLVLGEYTNTSNELVATVLTGWGTTWKSRDLQLPSNADINAADQGGPSFSQLVCPDAKDCVGDGIYGTAKGTQGADIETEVNGVWKLSTVPPAGAPEAYEDAYSVSCPAVDHCLVTSAAGNVGPQSLLLYRQQGFSWSAVTVPAPSGALKPTIYRGLEGLDVITCPSSTLCVYSGFYTDRNDDIQGLVGQGIGQTLESAQAPHPAGQGVSPDVNLTQDSCVKPGYCAAAGTFGLEGLMEVETAGVWKPVAGVVPASVAGGIYSFSSLSCGAAGQCVAVGTGLSNAGFSPRPVSIVMSVSSGKVSIVEPALPSGAASGSLQASELLSVACPQANHCIADGVYLDAHGISHGLILKQTNSGWVASMSPLPANPGALTQSLLHGISCTSATSCIAVGENYESSQGTPAQALMLTWNGTQWKATTPALPKNAAAGSSQVAFLNSVSCAGTSVCSAVGQFVNSQNSPEGLILTKIAGVWKPFQILILGASLYQASCTPTKGCVAFGDYQNSAGDYSFLVSGSGSSWKHVLTPIPGNNVGNGGALSVACQASGACVVAGDYVDQNGENLGFIDTGSGTSWNTQTSPLPPTVSNFPPNVNLASASCPSTGACLIAGEYDTGGPLHGLILQEK